MKKYFIISILIVAVLAFLGFINYQKIFAPSVVSDYQLQIKTGENFESVLSRFTENEIVKDVDAFSQVSSWMKYKGSSVPSGLYRLTRGMSNKDIVTKLRSGDQDPIRVTINNVRKIENLCAKFSVFMEVDSTQLLEKILSDSILSKYDSNREDVMSLFIPNTYEFWWNSSADEIIERMAKEKEKFWKDKSRIEKAEKLGLSQKEVYTLASIVEKETQANSEKSKIAGVYLNRLKRGMLLQADPTVVFATGKFDLKRVLNKHLEIDSPYNTYKNEGLPPGPIYMPGIKSIDAVLNPAKHKFLYFCAKPDNSGTHAFATNLTGHNKNAQRYWNWLRKNRIR